MNNHTGYLRCCLILIFLALPGCAPIIQPHVSSSEFLVPEDRIEGDIDVFISEEFRSYVAEKTDISEFKTWKFELGPVSIDTFRFALESRFKNVSVKLGEPQFSRALPAKGFYAAVKPSFAEFSASDPILLKFENYKVRLGFLVYVYDAAGEVIHTQTYTGEGIKQGSIGYADPGHAAYPVAVQEAVKNAIAGFVADLTDIAKDKKRHDTVQFDTD